MAILAYDDVMLREPRLLVPRLQPLGLVKVDWRNPLTRDLCFAWIGSYPLYDFARRRQGTGSAYSATAVTQYGKARYVTSNSAEAGDNFGNVQPITSNSFAVLSFAAPVASGDEKILFSQRQFSNPWTEIHLVANMVGTSAASGSAQIYCSDAVSNFNVSRASSGSTVVDGKPHVFIGTRGAGQSGAIFVDGINVSSTYANSATNNVYTSAQHTRINNLGAYSGTGYVNIDPNYLVLAWNRPLDLHEIAALSADPYQVFVPA